HSGHNAAVLRNRARLRRVRHRRAAVNGVRLQSHLLTISTSHFAAGFTRRGHRSPPLSFTPSLSSTYARLPPPPFGGRHVIPAPSPAYVRMRAELSLLSPWPGRRQ